MQSSLDLVGLHHPSGNLGDFFRPALAEHATRIALIDLSRDAERTLTYAQLERAIGCSCAVLRSLGVSRGDKVALALPNSLEFMLVLLAAMRLGAVPVLINFSLSLDTIKFILTDSGSRAICLEAAHTPKLAVLAADLGMPVRIALDGKHPHWSDFNQLCDRIEPETRSEVMAFDEQAFQPYTAGSTGVPKGIVLTHGGMLWGIEHSHSHWPATAGDRGIVAAPMFHKNAMRGTIKPLLRAGGSFVITRRFEPRSYLQAIEKYDVTQCGGVAAMFDSVLRERDLLDAGRYRSLRLLSLGSATVQPALMDKLAAAFPQAAIKESYGLTEGGGPLRPPLDSRHVPRGSVGVVAPETEVKLIGPDGGQHSWQGELCVRSPYVLKRYANRPDLTQSRLRDGWLHTGDLFRVDAQGFYYFLGRTDDMFVCGGENVYPKEVESLILAHPAVADAIVLPLPHAQKGFAPAALVVARPGERVEPRDVQDHCAAHGPAYSIPRAVLVAAEVPQTHAGKPDRKAAAHLLAEAFGEFTSSERDA